MSIVSKKWWEKYEDARVDLDPDVDFEVDAAIVWQHLVDAERVWDGSGEITRLIQDASDQKKADLVKIKGEGWFAITNRKLIPADDDE